MTVSLLAPYASYASGATVDLDNATESALVAQGRATYVGNPGSTFYPLTPAEQQGIRDAYPSLVSGAGKPDLIVVAGNPAGCEAAISLATIMGGTCTILLESDHVGGMMTGGLSAVDVQIPEWSGSVVGAAWKHQIAVAAELSLRPETFFRQGLAAAPSVVERVYRRRLAVRGITIVPNAKLESVNVVGDTIVSITAGGVTYSASYYADAAYTGDLVQKVLPSSSISIGRTPVTVNATDKDSYGGIRPTADTPQFLASVSPYNDPVVGAASGLCKGIWPNETAGNLGDPSPWVMGCGYRVTVCQTGDAAGTYTKVAMPDPSYDNSDEFELLVRDIVADVAAGASYTTVSGYVNGVAERTRNRLLLVPLVGTTKYDCNNGSYVSGTTLVDPVNTEYITASWARRAEIDQMRKDRFLGFWKVLRTDARLPAALRADAATYGLPSDEKNFELSYQRIGPQIKGAKILTDNRVVSANTTETDGIGVINYSKDSHPVRVYINGSSQIIREGSELTAQYNNGNPLPFWVALPKKSECRNLISLFALSVSASVMNALRMENMLQVIGEAAGICVGIAKNKGGIAVQDVLASEIQRIQDRFGVATKGGAILAQDGAAPYNGGGVTTGGTWSVAGTAAVLGRAAHAVANGTDVTASTSGSSTTLTIAATASGGAAVAVGQYVTGPGVVDGTTISAIGTYAAGSGTVTLSQAANVPAGSAVRLSTGRKDFLLNIGATGAHDMFVNFVVKDSSVRCKNSSFFVFDAGGTVPVTLDQNSGGEGGYRVNLGRFTLKKPQAAAVGSTSGASTTLTVASLTSGAIAVGQYVYGAGIPYGTFVSALGTGTGGAGTYTLNQAATVAASTPLYFGTPHFRADGSPGNLVIESVIAVPAGV